jgi:3-keto-5-aminohexanoate cleavage enzyme
MSWDRDPVVVTVAPCGAEVTREDNPNVPYTPLEIARESVRAFEAGATVSHLHVREPDGTPSGRLELFRETIDRIRADSEMLTMVSTGGAVGMGIDERSTGIEAGPDIAGVETGSLNFGEEPFVTTPEQARGIIDRAVARKIALEVEAFDVGHVVAALRMVEQGQLPSPLRVNLVLGVPGGIDASPSGLRAMLDPLPAGTPWTVTAVGRHQRRMLALALLHGASGIRVGLEDNVYRRRGVLAGSNAELVEDAVALVNLLGRRVATAAEAAEHFAATGEQAA